MPLRADHYFVNKLDKRPTSLELTSPRRRYSLYFFFSGIGFVGIVMALTLLPWQQSAVGKGRVIAYAPHERQQEISAPITARIKQWHVFEGSRVKAGETIVSLTDNDPEILDRLRSERDAIAKRAQAAEVAVQTSKSNYERQQKLFAKGLSSKKSVEQAKLKYTDYLVDEAEASAELARMDIRLARQFSQSVKAPIDGTVLRVLAGEGGQIVKAGQSIATIVPDTESRAVEIWINGNDMPLVREGARVRLQFEGWPALQFSGWPDAAVGTFGGKVSFIDAADNGRGQFRAIVVPVGTEWPSTKYLRQGVRAMAWVLLNEVNLGYELWRRFNGFPPNMPAKGDNHAEK